MPGFDRTGTWVEGPMAGHSREYRTKIIDAEKDDSSTSVEIGYRPLIYTVQPKSFDWRRLFSWLWSRNSN